MAGGTVEDWKKWAKVNYADPKIMPNELLIQKYAEGGRELVLAITCPPNRRPDTWVKQKESFLLLKEEELIEKS